LDSGDAKTAIEYYRKAVTARLTFLEKSPHSGTNRSALAECYTHLAKALVPHNQEDAQKEYSNAAQLLEPLSAANRSNSQYRIALANSLSDAAHLYVRMANEEPSTRILYLTKARSLYQRSQELWLELDKAGELPPAQSRSMQDVSAELVHCNDSLAKLQQAQ
jgi:hypothetical protein